MIECVKKCLFGFLTLGLIGLNACSSPADENPSENSPAKENTVSTGAHDLSLRLSPGENFNWKMSWNDETVTQIPDQERGQGWNDVLDATGYTLVMESHPEEILSNGKTRVRSEFIEVSSYYNGPDRELAYYSHKPETEPQSMGYHHFMGKSVEYELAKDGSINGLSGGKEIFSNFNDPKLTDIADIYAAEILEVYIHLLPNHPVNVGDSWKTTHIYSSATGIITDLTLTLKEVSEGLAQVEIASRTRNNTEAVPTDLGNGTSITYDMAGDGKGTVTLNMSNGLPIHLMHSFHLTGHTYFNIPGEETPQKYFTTKGFYYELQTI